METGHHRLPSEILGNNLGWRTGFWAFHNGSRLVLRYNVFRCRGGGIASVGWDWLLHFFRRHPRSSMKRLASPWTKLGRSSSGWLERPVSWDRGITTSGAFQWFKIMLVTLQTWLWDELFVSWKFWFYKSIEVLVKLFHHILKTGFVNERQIHDFFQNEPGPFWKEVNHKNATFFFQPTRIINPKISNCSWMVVSKWLNQVCFPTC